MKAAFALPVFLMIALLISPTALPDNPVSVEQSAGKMVTQEQGATQQRGLSVEASLMNVNVVITDDEGRAIPGLTKENFRVLDDGVPQSVTRFSRSTAPITIVMLLEYSSGAYNYYAAKASAWGAGFLDQLQPQDWVALVTYDLRPQVRVDFTHNRASVQDALGSLGFPSFRESNLYDALLETLDKLEEVRGRKSILLLSTGANSFSAATLDEVTKRLKATDVTIFGIGLAEGEYIRSRTSSIGYVQARTWLSSFSEQTGGFAAFPRFPAELPDVYRSIAAFLRNEYTLSFSPAREMRDGKYHKLRVQVIRPDGKPLTVVDEQGKKHKVIVYARSGYQAPSAPEEEAGSGRRSPGHSDSLLSLAQHAHAGEDRDAG
jgi:VWFA-related protein